MEYFEAHLDEEHARRDGTEWTNEDALVECCILIVDADFEWFASKRLLWETISEGAAHETKQVKNAPVNMGREETSASAVTARPGVMLFKVSTPRRVLTRLEAADTDDRTETSKQTSAG